MRERKYNFVYKITNNINGDYYIGVHSTDDLNDGYMGSGKRITRSINKYGVENFTREYIKMFDCAKDAYLLEAKIVTPELISDPHCLNIAEGGNGGNPLFGMNEQEYNSYCNKLRNAHKGKSYSKEHCKHISESRKGKPHPFSEEGKQRIRESNHNRIVSEDTRERKRKSMLGKNKGKSYPKISEAKIGTKAINNGKIVRFVKLSELDIFLNNGWSLGRIKLKKK